MNYVEKFTHSDGKYLAHISSKHRWFDLKLDEVWRYRDLILLFTRRSFTVSYKQTILGPLWLFSNPILTSIVYIILFGNIAKLGTDGVPQLLFYLSGNAIWGYFSTCLTNNASTFTSNAGLFGKVYFPRLVVPISNVFSAIIRFGIQMIMVLVLMVIFMIKGSIHPNIFLIILLPLLLIWLGILGMGCGIIISSMTTKYRDLQVLVSFGVQLWMYATPVVYPMSTVSGVLRIILLLNPVTMPIEIFRYILFGTGTIEPLFVGLSLIMTAIVMLLGIMIFNKVERTFMDTV